MSGLLTNNFSFTICQSQICLKIPAQDSVIKYSLGSDRTASAQIG